MGFLRGLGKFVGSIIFTTFLVLAILLMEIVDFTSYDNFKSVAGEILEGQLFSAVSDSDLDDLQNFMLFQCSGRDKVSVPLFGGRPIVLSCSDVANSNKMQLKSLITTALIDNFYHRDFNCSFIDCVTTGNYENLLIAVSGEGNEFYKSLQTYAWIGTALGLVILVMSTETWTGKMKGVGFNLVFVGLPFLLVGYFQSSLTPLIPPELEASVNPIMGGLMSSLKDKFMMVLVIGIVLVVAGYGLGFYLSEKKKK